MTIDTAAGAVLDGSLLSNYFNTLVNRFFKILPIRESKEYSTLPTYIRSLQIELLGCESFIPGLMENDGYLALLATLQFLMDNPECGLDEVRREVFRAIGICNKLKASYAGGEA